jgi:hypothetical protein
VKRCFALVGVALVAGCGGNGGKSAREWLANAHGVVRQLRADVVDVAPLDRVAPARAAMHDDSQVYELLVAYSDLGGCRHEVLALGEAPRGFAAAERELLRACVPLAQAARLFTHAMTTSRPAALVAATRASLRGGALLDRAALALANG